MGWTAADLDIDADQGAGTPTGVLARAVTLLELVSGERDGVGVRDVARRTGIDRSAVSRILGQLEQLDYVQQEGARGLYTAGPRLFAMAASLHGRDNLWKAAEPILRALVDRHGETCYLAVRHGRRLTFREKVDCQHTIRYVIELGTPFRLTTGAAGTAILAGMPDAEVDAVLAEGLAAHTPASITDPDAFRRQLAHDRRAGYSVSISRWVPNGAGIASPYFDADGACKGAVTLSCPADRLASVSVDEVGRSVRGASRALSRRLGYHGWWGPREE